MIPITVGNGRDIRSQIPQQFHAQYDLLAATGMSQRMLAAAMAELTSVKIAGPRPRAADGGSNKPPTTIRRSSGVALARGSATLLIVWSSG